MEILKAFVFGFGIGFGLLGGFALCISVLYLTGIIE